MHATVRRLLLAAAVVGLLVVGVVFADAATNGAQRTPAALAQYVPPSKGGGGGGSGGSSGVPPDLTVLVSSSASTTPSVGSELDFYLTVETKNVGGSSNTRLDLTLPAGWTYASSYADRGPGCTGTPPTLHCNTGWINPSTRTHVTLFGTVAQAGDETLVATITSLQEPEADPSNNTTTLQITPAGATTTHPPAPKPVLSAPTVAGVPALGAVIRVALVPGARYSWQLCALRCKPIAGATKPTLKITKAFLGHSLRIVVIANGTSQVSKKIPVRPRAAR
jgi:hypothetical protein